MTDIQPKGPAEFRRGGKRPAATDVNLGYYGRLSLGRSDYWRKMPAPLFRLETFLALLDEHRPAGLVDLGCGNGEILRAFRRRNPGLDLAGMDLSEAQIRQNQNLDPSIRWLAADLAAPRAFPDSFAERFDAVVASEIVEHVEDPAVFLRNAFALAKPGTGLLWLSTQSGPLRETESRVGHRRHFSAAEMETLLSSCGWAPLRVWNAGFPFHDFSKWLANLSPEASMRLFDAGAYSTFQNAVCWALRFAFRLNSNSRGNQLFAVARRG
jgi:2-polyprenyl-3-methyl-5-hydroxy-6-metoxy-1,4-benzoquinol methylase